VIDSLHSFGCLCNDASDNALEEESVLFIKDVEAPWEEEVEVQKPASATLVAAVHKIGNRGKVVEVE